MKRQKFSDFARELIFDFRWSQFFAMVCLMTLSLLFIYSATYKGGDQISRDVTKQAISFGIGIGLYFFIALMDYHWLCRKSWLIYGASIFILIFVLMNGMIINGSRSWIKLGSVSIQPSEFAKFTLLITLSYYLSRSVGFLNEARRLLIAIGLVLIPLVLIKKQPDDGTCLIIASLSFMLIFLAGLSIRNTLIVVLMGVLAFGAVVVQTGMYIRFLKSPDARDPIIVKNYKGFLPLKPYQLDRIVVVAAPELLDPKGTRWNRDQSLIAIGSGKINGKGWNQGDVTHGGYLPKTVSLNDFIFAVLAEETGFIGGIFLLILYLILLLGGIRIALKARDPLGTLLAGGVTFLLFIHIFVNMGMALGILPTIGVPLPLMSSGGSFAIVCLGSLGLLQSVWLHRKPY
jgi:rod shape determining protein RodA